jgi:hypothetical protein
MEQKLITWFQTTKNPFIIALGYAVMVLALIGGSVLFGPLLAGHSSL